MGDTSAEDSRSQPENRIQVSNVKKPLFFYVNLARRLLLEHEYVEFSALGLAISTLVTVIEILKQDDVAEITSTSPIPSVPPSLALPFVLERVLTQSLSRGLTRAELRTSTVRAQPGGGGKGDFKAKMEAQVRRSRQYLSDQSQARAAEAQGP